jgi:hypothetical protein
MRAHRRKEERVAVGRSLRGALGCDLTACTPGVLDDDLLPQLGSELPCHAARHDIGGASGRERHDHSDRLLGIGGSRHAA